MMRARSTFVLALALAACTPGGAAMTGGGGGAQVETCVRST